MRAAGIRKEQFKTSLLGFNSAEVPPAGGGSLGVALRDSGFGAKKRPKFGSVPWELPGPQVSQIHQLQRTFWESSGIKQIPELSRAR